MRTIAGIRATLLVAGIALVAACGGSALGFAQAPAALDPGSPKLAAVNIAFDRDEIDVRANAAFVLVFENRDNVPHNVSIYADASLQDRTFDGVVFSGPATRWYPIPALGSGTYVFVCDVHPNMKGVIRAS